MHEKVRSHACTNRDHEPSDPELWKPQRIVRAKVSTHRRAANHDQRLGPVNRMFKDEYQDGDPIGRAAEDDLERVHLVNVAHAESSQHGENHESHAATKVAAINSDQELKKHCRGDRASATLVRNSCFVGSRQPGPDHKQQRRHQHEPGQDSEKCVRRCPQQQNRAGNSANQTHARERDQECTLHF